MTDASVGADNDVRLENGVRRNSRVLAQRHAGTHNRARPNGDSGFEHRGRVDERITMNVNTGTLVLVGTSGTYGRRSRSRSTRREEGSPGGNEGMRGTPRRGHNSQR